MDFERFEDFWPRVAREQLGAPEARTVEAVLLGALGHWRICVVCRLLHSRAFDVASRWQYLLSQNPAAQAEFVARQTWCNEHAWFFHTVITPRDLARLQRKLQEALQVCAGATLHNERAHLVGGTAQVLQALIGERRCPLCDDRASLEAVLLEALARGLESRSLRSAFASSAGCCVPHLAALLHEVADEDTAAYVLEAVLGQSSRLAAELDVYEAETESRRRQYGGAADAPVRAMIAWAGMRGMVQEQERRTNVPAEEASWRRGVGTISGESLGGANRVPEPTRIQGLAGQLGDLSRNREALALLILQGERAIPALTEVLLGPPSSLSEPRCLAAEALGAIGGEQAVSALIRVFMAHDVRRLDPVLRLAEDAVRNRAAEQLGKLGDRRAVGPLIYALAREGVREAMGALARFGEPRAIPLIVRKLEDPCDRAAAAEALLAFGAAAVLALAATLTECRPCAEDEAPVSVERRAEAARLLGMLGDTTVAPALRWCLEDPASAVQLEAALALIALLAADAPERALATVALGLGHPSVPMGARCADALVAAGDRSIPHVLAAGAPRSRPATQPPQPSDDALQVMAIEVIERLGTETSTRAIESFLHDRSSLVRRRADRALQHLGIVASSRNTAVIPNGRTPEKEM